MSKAAAWCSTAMGMKNTVMGMKKSTLCTLLTCGFDSIKLSD
jgi:hypothetical protein